MFAGASERLLGGASELFGGASERCAGASERHGGASERHVQTSATPSEPLVPTPGSPYPPPARIEGSCHADRIFRARPARPPARSSVTPKIRR